MKNCIITIPIYKQVIEKFETISLKSCLRTFKNYDICIFTFEGLDIKQYLSIFCQHGITPKIELFDKKNFDGISGYNNLMLSCEFYERFKTQYEYLLIYQLDCYVFEDTLKQFIDKGCDYWGAPIPEYFKNYIKKDYPSQLSNGYPDRVLMNGGLSLRKISAFYNICSHPEMVEYKNWYEDIIFSLFLSNLPTRKEALNFSFECYPKECYAENGYALPMGCHAWYKCGGGVTDLYDDLFWFKRIVPFVFIKESIFRQLFKIYCLIKKTIKRQLFKILCLKSPS